MKKLVLYLLLVLPLITWAQTKPSTYIDNKGVIRWSKDKKEVKGFGVNYTVPFAHAYRTAQKMKIDPKKAIDQDVYHFKRLGFDLYRVHIWDTEISDSLGNVIQTEQLDHFDYLIKKLNEYDINYVLTPIAFWGNGWPEPDAYSPGFSHKYGKDNCLTDPDCIAAQERYLEQFMNHKNPYTGLTYKEDPRLIAVEVSNEPHHRGEAKDVQVFVSKMVKAIQASGFAGPIFYNGSHAVHFTDAYFQGGVVGGTFQWYPTGLGYQREIPGNLLPNVNKYDIPFDDSYKKHQGAKLVYEFDAADVGRTYIYPAMARSFREAGIQIATHFSYDPTFMAAGNTEYNTHYMNLAYTPGKAISLMISGEVFRNLPMYKDYGVYPKNNQFGDFKVDYFTDLAIYNAENKFLYTNSHDNLPKNSKKLQQIAGVGNSPIVKYEGTGAYFLDKLGDGTWRLEVMPDALWVSNPFGRNSLEKTVGVIHWEEHTMQVLLEDLKDQFHIEGLNSGNPTKIKASGNTFTITPGTYILSAKTSTWKKDDVFRNGLLSDFAAPKSTTDRAYLIHEPIQEISENDSLRISVSYISPEKPTSIRILAPGALRQERLELKEGPAYQYSAVIPADKIRVGILSYYIIVEHEGETTTYPAGKAGEPFGWDFYDRQGYEVKVVPSNYPIHLFNAKDHSDLLVRQWRRGMQLAPTTSLNEWEYQMKLDKLFVEDQENLKAKPIYDYTFKHYLVDAFKGRKKDLAQMKTIVMKGRSLENKPLPIQVALVMDNGSAFGGMMKIDTETNEYRLDINSLKPVATVTLPRPYPSFLPYFFEHLNTEPFDITRIESIQFSIGPGLSEAEQQESFGLGLVQVRLE